MKKSLLVGLMALSTSLSGYAFEAGEYVYAPQGRFKISSSDNLCTNSTCEANFSGWTVISATATAPDEVFQYDPVKKSFSSKTDAAGEGMYYKFNVQNPNGTYVVSFKLRQETAAYPYSTNILVTPNAETGVNTYGIQYANYNYVNVFGNSGSSFTSSTDYVSYGKELMLTKDWNNVAFAIVGDGTPRDYYIAFSGLNTTLEITDVQIQEAVQYADLRQRDNAVGYARAIINAAEWEASDELASVVELTEALEALGDETSQSELNDLIEGLMGTEGALASVAGTGFLDVQLSNYIATCAVGTDWAQRTGNGKIQKQQTVGDWTFFGGGKDRGYNQDGADLLGVMSKEWWELGHYGYGYAPAEAGMAMKKTLQPGVYIYSMKASGATRYNGKEYGNGWYNNLGFTPFDFELYVKDAAGKVIKSNVVATPSTDYAQNYITFTIETAGNYEIGAKTYPREDAYFGTLGALGYAYYYKEPRIYCKLSGKYTAEEKAYIDNVKAQIEAVKTALAEADSLSNLTNHPWLKKEMADTIAKYKPFNDFYQTLTDDDIFNGFVDPVVQIKNSGYANYIDGQDPETGKPIPTYNAKDTIMVNAVKPLKRYNEAYIAANKVFPELQSAIDNANNVRAMAIYSVATGKDDLDNAITTAVNAYTQYAQNGSYTVGAEENKDYDAVVEAKNTLNAAVEEFKTTIPAEKITTIVDIDFSGDAVLDESINKYSIAGTKGAMVIDNYSTTTDGNYSFTKGFDQNGDNPTVEVLRVGNGNGVVSVAPEEYAGKIVRITFDYYFGALKDRSTGFYLKNDANENVAGLFYSPYSATIAENTFGFDIAKFSAIGSSSASNAAIYDEAKNKTSFELVLVYPQQNMYATSTNSAKGSQTTKPVALSSNFTQFVVTSGYSGGQNWARRSWFDNLKIETIEYDPNAVTGVQEVSEAADEAIYNIAGQKVSAPVKGQIYVKKGAAFVK